MSEAALAVIGHNNPPEPTPFELSSTEADDLFLEASNWCDGAPIENQEQADTLSGLLALIKAAAKRADERRKEEAKPHDDAKAEIQARYNTLIGTTKAVTGKLVMAEEACKKALAPWLRKLDEERRAAAEAARKAEEEARAAAAEAFRKAREENDLAARAEAERLAREVAEAEKTANRAEKATTVKTGLRTTYSAHLADIQAFARWSWGNDTKALGEYFESRANVLVKTGRRDLPGIEVIETKEAR